MALGAKTARLVVSLPVETKEWVEQKGVRLGVPGATWARMHLVQQHRREQEQQQGARP